MSRVDASIVVHPDNAIYLCHQLSKRSESVRVAKRDFELPIERLLVAVLPWTSRMRSGDHDTKLGKDGDEALCLILLAVVRVEDLGSWVVEQRIAQRLDRERSSFSQGNIHPDNLSGIQIDDGCNVHPPPLIPDFREVCGPDMSSVWRVPSSGEDWHTR